MRVLLEINKASLKSKVVDWELWGLKYFLEGDSSVQILASFFRIQIKFKFESLQNLDRAKLSFNFFIE